MTFSALRRQDDESPGRPTRQRIRTVTGDTFDELVLGAAGPVAVEFMTYGCSHCRSVEPILQQVAEMVEPAETVVRVNIALERDLATSYQIRGTPTLIVFLNSREVARSEGLRPTVATVLAAVTGPFGQ